MKSPNCNGSDDWTFGSVNEWCPWCGVCKYGTRRPTEFDEEPAVAAAKQCTQYKQQSIETLTTDEINLLLYNELFITSNRQI